MNHQPKQPRPETTGLPTLPVGESPHHGYQGDRAPAAPIQAEPASLTIAVSREAGARGSTIAKRVGRLLGWQVYNQELLEYLAQEGSVRERIGDTLPPGPIRWMAQHLEELQRRFPLGSNPTLLELARTIVALAAQGEVILVGRGAGLMLASESTLNVRIIAPLPQRVAYMSQWLRLSLEEAAEQVELRDRHRSEYVTTQFQQNANYPHLYDLILNSSLLGEELCAELIAQAARVKLANRRQPRDAAPPWLLENAEEAHE